MWIRRSGPGLSVFALWFLAASCTAPSEELSPAREEAIRDSVRTFLDTWEARAEDLDLDGMAELYSGDEAFRWLEDGQVRYTSRDEVLSSLRGLRGLTGLEYESESVRIDPVGPGAAVVTARFTQSFTYEGGGGFSFSGALSAVVRHEARGWRFVVGHASTASEGGGEEAGPEEEARGGG